jgi:hypothetical protein
MYNESCDCQSLNKTASKTLACLSIIRLGYFNYKFDGYNLYIGEINGYYPDNSQVTSNKEISHQLSLIATFSPDKTINYDLNQCIYIHIDSLKWE